MLPTAGIRGIPQRIELDESTATSSYANFCRVTGAPEELILDFALNAVPAGTAGEPIRITQRVLLSYTTARRFLFALEMAVRRHEMVFGEIGIESQKGRAGGSMKRNWEH